MRLARRGQGAARQAHSRPPRPARPRL